jgi:hypothetical protein
MDHFINLKQWARKAKADGAFPGAGVKISQNCCEGAQSDNGQKARGAFWPSVPAGDGKRGGD